MDENQCTVVKYQIIIPIHMFFSDGGKVDKILSAVPGHTIPSIVEDILNGFLTDKAGS